VFERYTQTARRVIFSARYMASRVGSSEIETEHLLLGLLREDKGLGSRFLGSPWAAEEIWKNIEQSKPVREKVPGPVDIPLSSASKRALRFAAEEADLLSNRHICSEHLLLGLLREEKCFAAEILQDHGVRLTETRGELRRMPHDDSAIEGFVRERGSRPKDVAELQSRIRSIKTRIEEAIANQDFATAKAHSDEEAKERDKLFLLYQRYGLLDWIYD
jgi:ATP-dependent Clp protease ATP-binding subunit ClpC